jgi:hypothetical protein
MNDPTGPRDAGDADDSDARHGDVAPDTWGKDDVDHDEGGAGDQDAPVDDRRLVKATDPDPDPGADPGADAREHEWAMDEAERAAAHEYEERDRRPMISVFLVGALAGMLALGLVWATTAILADSDSGRVATTAMTDTATTDAEPSQQTQSLPEPSQEDRCRQADAELAGLLRAAVPALDQWEIHIGAMNKLVVGAITLQQATAFWDQTRVGADRNLDRFHSATRRVPFAGVDCPSPDSLTQASAALSSCARHVAQERQAFEAARIAMATWKKHVRHMEMLRMGHMSPAAATRLWLASWQEGIRELQAYRSAERPVDRSGRC